MAVIFAADFADSPLYDFTSAAETNDQYWDKAHRATDGPDGGPAAELALVPTGDTAQFFAGWSKTGLTAPTTAVTRYTRFYMRVLSGWTLGAGNKMVILGDTGIYGGSSRVIIEFKVDNSEPKLRIQRNIEGDDDRSPLVALTPGTWHAFQCESASSQTIGDEIDVTSMSGATPPVVTTATAHGYSTGQHVVIVGNTDPDINGGIGTITVLSSTTFSLDGFSGLTGGTGGTVRSLTADASYRIWKDNDTQGSPDAETTGGRLVPFDWINVNLGYFMNALATGNDETYQWAGFELADTFDASWFANMGEAPAVTLTVPIAVHHYQQMRD